MTSPLLGMFFGFINTATIHLAKGMQKHGIDALRWRSTPRHERSGKIALIYVAGIVLNNFSAVWLVLANRFAQPAYATGMFGLGLILLLVYSSVFLNETVYPANYVGAALVIAGTVAVSVHALGSPSPALEMFNPRAVLLFALVYFSAAGVFLTFGLRSGHSHLLGFSCGLVTGSLAGLDPVLKSMGQIASGTASIFPSVPWGWIPFLISFPVAIGAFLLGQFAFYRGASAGDTISAHSSFYILVPVVVQMVALPGFQLTVALGIGILSIVVGIFLLQRRGRVDQSAPSQEISES